SQSAGRRKRSHAGTKRDERDEGNHADADHIQDRAKQHLKSNNSKLVMLKQAHFKRWAFPLLATPRPLVCSKLEIYGRVTASIERGPGSLFRPLIFQMNQTTQKKNPLGYVTFALHSHLPYVVNHGTWPHGMERLHEAAAGPYLPLLRVFKDLEQQGLALKANVNLSPILLEQLSHPVFKDEFPKYLLRKIQAAHKDAEDFTLQGEKHMVEVAKFWQNFYQQALRQFDELNANIIR